MIFPKGTATTDFRVRIVRDTKFPPMSHKLTLGERWELYQQRQRILREESK